MVCRGLGFGLGGWWFGIEVLVGEWLIVLGRGRWGWWR